jgi:hypothetical protein
MTRDSHVRRRRRLTAMALLAPLTLGAIAAAADDAAAQGGHRTVVGLMPMAGSTTITTRSASAGAKIWIRTANLPARTEMQIMMGALRDGFEVISTTVTDDAGKIGGMDSLQVTVPTWVTQDRPYLVIVTDLNYNPLGSADMFHPTDRNGLLARTGRVSLQGTSCHVLTGDADEIYYLTGITSGLQMGDRIKVVGRPVESTTCGKGTTIEVQKAERVTP